MLQWARLGAILFIAIIIFSGISWLYQSSAHIFVQEVFAHKQLPFITTDYVFTSEDTGESAVYPVGKEFVIIVDQRVFAKNLWSISCRPAQAIKNVGQVFLLLPPLYGFRYEGLGQGTCSIRNNTFSLKVNIVHSPI